MKIYNSVIVFLVVILFITLLTYACSFFVYMRYRESLGGMRLVFWKDDVAKAGPFFVYYINLDISPERNLNMIRQCEMYHLHCVRIQAAQLLGQEEQDTRGWQLKSALAAAPRANVATMLSHIRVWEAIESQSHSSDRDWNFVMEDDVTLLENPLLLGSPPPDAELVQLAHDLSTNWQSPWIRYPMYMRCRPTSGAFAYMIRSSLVRYLLNQLRHNHSHQVPPMGTDQYLYFDMPVPAVDFNTTYCNNPQFPIVRHGKFESIRIKLNV